jgi:hypothetical protein
MVGTSCLLGEAEERHTPCFGGIGFRRRDALQRSGVLPMRLRVDGAWLRHSGLAAHWAVTTSSGGAGRRRAHSRTRQRQMSSATYGGRKSRGVGMMLLWRTKAASAEQKKCWRRGETRSLLGFDREEHDSGTSSSARLDEEKMEREEPRTVWLSRCKKERGGGPAAWGTTLKVAGSRWHAIGVDSGQQQHRVAI